MTLLEVMAAVAILGLVYTVLATAATRGIRIEGDSRRRMEASLLAEQALAEIETQLATGVAPQLGTQENERDGYLVSVDAEPFELPVDLASALPAAAAGVPSVFGGGGAPSLVSRITIRVSWPDGLEDRSLELVTFAFDPAEVSALVGDLADSPRS
jgi:type II secretory pathway pseudopilin PulG